MIWFLLESLAQTASSASLDLFAVVSLIPSRDDFPELGGAFASGKFSWNDILYYGIFLIKFLLLGAGIQAIIGIMQGGYRYILGSVVEEKEKGRDTLKNTLIGFALVVLAWAIVDLVIALLTSG